MDGTLYTLEEASKLTGLSPEALRKRFMRGQLDGVSSKASNDGKVRVRLTETQVADLRRPDGQVDEESPAPDGRIDGDLTVHVLSRLADSLERRLARAEEQADQARGALDNERTARDQERQEWTRRLDGITAELTAMREGRVADRRAAMAAIERLKRGNGDLQAKLSKLHEVLADAPRRGILDRLFRRRQANHIETKATKGERQ